MNTNHIKIKNNTHKVNKNNFAINLVIFTPRYSIKNHFFVFLQKIFQRGVRRELCRRQMRRYLWSPQRKNI